MNILHQAYIQKEKSSYLLTPKILFPTYFNAKGGKH